MSAGEQRRGNASRIAASTDAAISPTSSASATMLAAGRVCLGSQPLGEPALEPERRQQREQLDRHQRRGEPPERLGAIEPAGDEQKRDARGEPQEEAEEVGASALGERGDVVAAGCLCRSFDGQAPGSRSARSGRLSSSDTMARAGAVA